MTREEREKAIDLLDNLIGVIADNQNNDYDKALKMGIESLRKEPCEDCISREEIISKISEYADGFRNGGYFSADSVEDAIMVCVGIADELPPVTPTQRWIPCSERLPEDGQRVLVTQTFVERNVVYATRFPFDKTKEKYIIAWMPLPKPYQEIESEQLLSYADQDTMQPAT